MGFPGSDLDSHFPEAMDLIRRHDSIDTSTIVSIGDIRLHVRNDVLNPTLTSTSQFFARSLLNVLPSGSLLEVGCGSGYVLLAVGQSRHDIRLHGCDREPAAIALAESNLRMAGVEARISYSDVFSGLDPKQRYDSIAFNPPLLHGNPGSSLERSIFDPAGRTVSAFIAGLRNRVAPGGSAYLLYTNRKYAEYDSDGFLNRLCERNSVIKDSLAELDRGFELYTLWRLVVSAS